MFPRLMSPPETRWFDLEDNDGDEDDDKDAAFCWHVLATRRMMRHVLAMNCWWWRWRKEPTAGYDVLLILLLLLLLNCPCNRFFIVIVGYSKLPILVVLC